MLKNINKLRNNGLIMQYTLCTDLFLNHVVEFLKDPYNSDVTFISNGSNDVDDKHISKNSIESVSIHFNKFLIQTKF